MKIPFLDLKATYTELKYEIDTAVAEVLESGWYILGEEVTTFENDFANYTGAVQCIGVGNGLEALHLVLRAMGVGEGDEVIVPSNTYIATWLAVSQVGAVPVPVEPVEHTFNIDPSRLEAALTPRTKAVLPVHLYGQCADLAPIYEFAEKHGLFVLEDAAQAHGARYQRQRIGSHGKVGAAVAWSFYPGKNLGAFGDGGAVTTSDPDLAERIRVLANYGSRVKYVNDVQGYNSRLDPIQAAVLRVKLAHLDEWNARRVRIAELYLDRLKNHTSFALPSVSKDAEHVWHLFVIRTLERERLQTHLRERGVGTLIHYPIPPHLQTAYATLGYSRGSFPISERIHNEVISLPIGPHLSLELAEQVVRALLEF